LTWRSKPSSWALRGPREVGMDQIRLVAEAVDASASAGAEGDVALDGGAGEAGQNRGSLRELVGRGVVVFRLELAADEQPPDLGADGGADVRDALVARWGRGVKGELP